MAQIDDNFIPIILVDFKEHTSERPFCNQTLNPDCPCREDQIAIQEVNNFIRDGLMTVEEAQRAWRGEML